MSSGPRPDLPFAPEILNYIARRLQACGRQPDRTWLSAGMTTIDWMLLDAHRGLIDAARGALPSSPAQWQMSEFYRYALPPATFDLQAGPLTRFNQFALLYERLLGTDARPWLPSLFLAAAASPNVDEEHRRELVGRFVLDYLEFEQPASW